MSSIAIKTISVLISEKIAVKIKPRIEKVNAAISNIFTTAILGLNYLREDKRIFSFDAILRSVVVLAAIFIVFPEFAIGLAAVSITMLIVEAIALNLLIKKSFSPLLKLADTTSDINTLRQIIFCLSTIIQSQKTTEVMKEQALNKLWKLTDNSNEEVLDCIGWVLANIMTAKSNLKQKEAILEKLPDLNENISTLFIVTLKNKITSQDTDEAEKKRALEVLKQCTNVSDNLTHIEKQILFA